MLAGYILPGGPFTRNCYIEEGTLTFDSFLYCLWPGFVIILIIFVGIAVLVAIVFICGFSFLLLGRNCKGRWQKAKRSSNINKRDLENGGRDDSDVTTSYSGDVSNKNSNKVSNTSDNSNASYISNTINGNDSITSS